LCIDDSDGSLIACILPHMPEDMRRMLTVHLKACFEDEPENLEETDSSSQGERYSFPALHFSWYNRHGTRGHDVPVDAHPMLIEREDTSRTNYSQMLPYESREKTKHMKLYNNLNRIFARVFEWIAGQIKDVLRMDYDDLRIDADMLPGNAHSIVYPFLSLVVNLNVATLAHRDHQDKTLCVVLVIGEFDGGDLCLYEPGLVIPLRNGDIAAFPS
ncbi:uncharacterized protein C8Q71DRAFT_686635, partial [Rhodofomes roseus]